MAGHSIELIPHDDVVLENGRMSATSCEPWLRFRDANAFAATGFVEMTYRCGVYDDPVRPVLRFVTKKGEVERILPGPVAGAGVWRGAAPRSLDEVLISPSARRGRFDFIVESVKPLRFFDMLKMVWEKKRPKLWSVLLPTAFGYFAEAENAMDWALGAEPLEQFESWSKHRERPLDVAGLDAPRFDWTSGPRFSIAIDTAGASAEALARTQAALAAQSYPRVCWTTDGAQSHDADFIARIRAGDVFVPHALAAFAEEITRSPNAKLLYADELIETGGALVPEFKPNWSPLLQSERPYLGRCAFAHRDLPKAEKAPHEVVHLRRWLMQRADDDTPPPTSRKTTSATPSVSIIMLTKDRADLLGPCLDSILQRTTHPDFELIIVDNGTRQAQARKILEKSVEDRRVHIFMRPGPFNFARLNNDAVRESRGRVLVFLNNDTEIITGDWLERLSREALDPDAGGVGPLLLFPDGRVQHAGVTIGLGQDAGHFGALEDPQAPSWLDAIRHRHETSAVTAACMALERRKFDAVRGFDETNLPIEFNDVDLCLRLAENGWRSRYTPLVRVTHKESASRGNALLRPLSVYARERAYFRRRWRAVIRDDPYFHPAFSLYSRRPALS